MNSLKMKKLRKLLIKPEKILKNEELVFLKGGSYEGECDGVITCGSGTYPFYCACLSAIGAWCGCYSSEPWADKWAGLGVCEGDWECYPG